MTKRGRKSGAELSVVCPVPIEEVRRPAPPGELTAEQRREWLRIVNALPADWFPPETLGLLLQYCRHFIAARRVAQLVEALEGSEDFNTEEYDRLLKMQEREGRALSSLATRMRITQQALRDYRSSKDIPGAKPWDTN